MNKKQKKVLIIVFLVIITTLIIWLAYGGHFFTRSQVLVEKKDELFPDMVEKQWVDKFIWGLDLSLIISSASVLIGGVLFFLYRKRKKADELFKK